MTTAKTSGSAFIPKNFIKETFIGLTVALVILNLGAAMGLLSGRGAWMGMLSAGFIALITSILSGTRIQNSSPTAPMAALMAVIVGYSGTELLVENPEINPVHFVNAILLMSGVFLILGAIFGLGRYAKLVPNIVISGFMSGIALLIWRLEFSKFFVWFSLNRQQASIDLLLVVLTVLLSFILPKMIERVFGKNADILPGTLLSLVLITIAVNVLGISATFLEPIGNQGNILSMAWLGQQFPTSLSTSTFVTALPYALELALLCGLDTLVTALIIARLTGGEIVRHRRDLGAQGVASLGIGLIGGVPGAQSTAPSVLLIKEHANGRWAAISTGLFALIIAFAITPWLQYVPIAVFSGILIKVGYNVFDKQPLKDFIEKPKQSLWPISLLIGTMLCTAFVDIILAVFMFTIIYYAVNKSGFRKKPIKDLK